MQDVRPLLPSGNAAVSQRWTNMNSKGPWSGRCTRITFTEWVIALAVDRIAELVEAVTYPADDPGAHACVTFCTDQEILEELLALRTAAGQEEVRLGLEALTWTAVKGATLDSELSRVTAESRYKSTTTTRNLRTLLATTAA